MTTRIQPNNLYFYLMDNSYYSDFANYDEFQEDSARGHGIMIINIENYLVSVPVRSKIEIYRNDKGLLKFKKYYNDNEERYYYKGIDFSKIILVNEEHIDFSNVFTFADEEEKIFYYDNFNRIKKSIENYIKKYIRLCKKIENGEPISRYVLRDYRFTTLVNFHEKLSIGITKERFLLEVTKLNNQ